MKKWSTTQPDDPQIRSSILRFQDLEFLKGNVRPCPLLISWPIRFILGYGIASLVFLKTLTKTRFCTCI